MALKLSMSWQAVPNALIALGNPNATQLYAVCAGIANRHTGEIEASVDDIGETVGLGRATIKEARRFLEENGWLELRGRPGMQRWFIIPPPNKLRPPTPVEKEGGSPSKEAPPTQETPRSEAAPTILRDQEGTLGLPSDRVRDPEETERRRSKARAKAGEVDRVIAAWETASGTTGHARDTALNTRITTAINAAGVEKCVAAVRGIWQDDWWASRNPTIGRALKDAETIERFAAMAPKDKQPADTTAEWDAAFLAALRSIADAPRVPCPRPEYRGLPTVLAAFLVDTGERVPLFGDSVVDNACANAAAARIATRAVEKITGAPNTVARGLSKRAVDDFEETVTRELQRRGAA